MAEPTRTEVKAAPASPPADPPTNNPPREGPPADAIATLPDGTVEPGAAALQKAIQENRDRDNAKGHRGNKPGAAATPNSHYTLGGVTSGRPVPETTVRQA